MTFRTVAVVVVALLFATTAVAQVIPSSRLDDWSVAGYPGEIPTPSTIIDASAYGAVGNGTTPTNAAVSAAITALGGQPGVVYLPSGHYLFTATVSLPSGVVLRGAGSASTILQFNMNGAASDCLAVSGGASGGYTTLAGGYVRGSRTITLASAVNFSVGDYAEIHQTNGSWDTNPADWAAYAIGQIVRISAVDGTTLTLETPLRYTYEASLTPQIRKLVPRVDVGIESLKVERTDNPAGAGYNIGFTYAARCWLKDVESGYSAGSHVMINAGTRIEVTGCYFHDAFGYDGTGTRGYGVTLNNHAGECLVENNIFKHLRHAMMTKMGANGNVIAYNYSRENYRSETFNDLSGDISLHGHWSFSNLFEGNIVQTIMIDHYWGASGPYNTFFRNRTELYGLNFTSATGGSLQTSYQNVVGNEITKDNYSLWFQVAYGGYYELRGDNNFAHGNLVDTSIEPSGTGTLSDTSYYRASGEPSCYLAAHYPPIGIPNSLKQYINRARERWNAGGPYTYLDLRVSAGPDVEVIYGNSVLLAGSVSGGKGPFSYQWSPESGLNDSHVLQPLASPSQSADYTLIVTDQYGCAQSRSVHVRVTGTVNDPVFDPPPGDYYSQQQISLSVSSPMAVIHYTLNGAEPTLDDPEYDAPIPLDTSVTLKARAFRPDWTPSAIKEGVYSFIDLDECEMETDDCAENADCLNSWLSYTCSCMEGYEGNGFTCNPVCDPECVNGDCTAPDLCSCDPGWSDALCDIPVCSQTCMHGNCTAPEICTCGTGWSGNDCSTPLCNPACGHGVCTSPDLCTCDDGWSGVTCGVPDCGVLCDENASCSAPYTCTCNEGYHGDGQTCEEDSQCYEQDDWTYCDDGACFAGYCEDLGENDTCETYTELTVGVQHEATLDGFHSYMDASDCGSDELSGPDAFYMFDYEPGYAYTITATPVTGFDLVLALWSACEEAECLEALNDGGEGTAEALSDLVFDESGSQLVQVIDVTADSSRGIKDYSILLEATPLVDGDADADADDIPDGDEIPDGDSDSDTDTDTDTDNIPDGDEVTDGDEIPDGDEIIDGDEASDGDETPDGDEIIDGDENPDGDDITDGDTGPDGDTLADGDDPMIDGDSPATDGDGVSTSGGGSGGGCTSTGSGFGLLFGSILALAILIRRRREA